MKTKVSRIKDFDTVEVFRDIKTRISKEIIGMTHEELTTYLKKHKLKAQE